ncbi:MAG: TrbC/VirB2 family protein, partial [Rickettsiales bacterium]|nr:TrbC/VirB2 family protein [Rickettsiales bacterium]
MRIFLFTLFVFTPLLAYASGSVFDASACNVLNIVTGTPGKVFAAFAVVATGTGFFTGKISWGLCIGVVGGIAVIFGAPSVVAAISGKPMFECQQGVQYVSDCSGSSCYSCPMGFTGEDCDSCATGYAGINCDSCASGYMGYNCEECDSLNGYYSSGDYCFKACVVNFVGIQSGSVAPTNGLEYIECDEVGFAGQVSYTCINEVFEVTPGEVCGCEGNRGGANCDQCQVGYDIATDCTELLDGYYDTPNGPQPECDVSGESHYGVDFQSVDSVLPLDGTLGCSLMGYDGHLDYTCDGGVFGYTGACSCAPGYSGSIDDCAASCDVGYDKDLSSGDCRKGCDVSEPGLTTVWVNMTSVEEALNCDSPNFEGDWVYKCDPDNLGLIVVEDNCVCQTGYSGSDCLSCDTIEGYSDDGSGNCLAGCTIDIAGSSVVWVSPTPTQLSIPCDETNYEGNVNYTCASNNFSTTDSCSCIEGYDIANSCLTCDSSSGYRDDGSGVCVAGCDIAGRWGKVSEVWVPEGSSTVQCSMAEDGYTRTIGLSCSENNITITSNNAYCVCENEGYTGIDCSECDSANGYSMQSGTCKSGCYVNMAGVTANLWVNKTASTSQLSCSVGNFEGTINYTCDGSNFSASNSCSCKVGYSGSNCDSCDVSNHYNLVSGFCQKSCAVPSEVAAIQGIQGVPNFVTQGNGSFSCSTSTTSGINHRSSIGYTCDGSGNLNVAHTTCACDAGYAGVNCDQIDTANGYVDDGSGNPVMSCPVSLTGISE